MYNINEFHPYFLTQHFDVKKYNHRNKKIKKNKLDNNYDKAFFNFLDIIKYKIPINYNKIIERQIKLEICQQMENFKFKTKDKVNENLCYDEHINLFTLSCLCNFFDINIMFVNENVYCILNHNNINNNVYGINKNKDIYNIKNDKLEFIKENYYKIDNITKPIYSITKYKLDELKEIATILHLEYDNKYKKNNIYELIKEHLNNIIFF